MLRPVNILITGIGAPGAPSIVKCFRKNNERETHITGVDMNSTATARRLTDSFHVVPSAGHPDFIGSVLEICKKNDIRVLFPLVTRELEAFARNKQLFKENGIEVSVMNPDVLSIVNNKASLLSKMKELGMRTPKFEVVYTVDELEDSVKKLGYPDVPVVVKGAKGNGSRGVRIIDAHKSHYDLLFNEKPNSMYMSYHDLIEALREKPQIPEMVVMEYLPGQEYGVDALCRDGEVIYIGGRYNATVNSSIPQASIIEEREDPISLSGKIIKELSLDGNVNFDFKYDENGDAQLMEINPRLSATIIAYAPAGINFPYLRLKQLLGEDLPQCTIKTGIKMQRRYNEVFFSEQDEEIGW